MNDSTIRLISTADDNYAQHLGVMLFSVFHNKLPDTKINVYIIDGGISKENKGKLNKIAERFGFVIKYFNKGLEKYKNYHISQYINQSTYYRISIPELFDESINKVLYMDADMLVLNDIKELWTIDISNYYCAAVENPYSEFDKKFVLKYPRKHYYFNAGLLLINLLKWREGDISRKIIDFIEKNPEKLQWWDQDAINAIIDNEFTHLPPKWNVITSFFEIDPKETSFGELGLRSALNKPCIVHFTGQSKPWRLFSYHPYRKYYYKYLRETPWKWYVPSINSIDYNEIKYNFLNRHKQLFRSLKKAKGILKTLGIKIPF